MLWRTCDSLQRFPTGLPSPSSLCCLHKTHGALPAVTLRAAGTERKAGGGRTGDRNQGKACSRLRSTALLPDQRRKEPARQRGGRNLLQLCAYGGQKQSRIAHCRAGRGTREHFGQHRRTPAAAEAALKKSARFNPAAEAAAGRRGVAETSPGGGCAGPKLRGSAAAFESHFSSQRYGNALGSVYWGREYVTHEPGYSSRTISKLSCKRAAASPRRGAPLSSPSPGSSTWALLSSEKELGRWGWGLKGAPAPRAGHAARTAPQLAPRLCSSPVSPRVWLLFPRTASFSARLRARPVRSVLRNFR